VRFFRRASVQACWTLSALPHFRPGYLGSKQDWTVGSIDL
jgi:hypothetical protein